MQFFFTLSVITQYTFFGNWLLITKYLKCYFMYVCKCVSLCICTHTGELPVESIESVGLLGAGVTGSRELLCVGAGKQTPVLRKSGTCS